MTGENKDIIKNNSNRGFAFIAVIVTIVLQLVAAVVLKYTSDNFSAFSFSFVFFISLTFGIQMLRFIVWGIIHKKHDLSKSYPYISIFFPLIYLVTILRGEAVLETTKLIGVCLIIVGIFYLHKSNKQN